MFHSQSSPPNLLRVPYKQRNELQIRIVCSLEVVSHVNEDEEWLDRLFPDAECPSIASMRIDND